MKDNEILEALYTDYDGEERDPLRIVVRLKEVLKEKGVTQKELATMTGIRPAAISELANNLRTTINREHVELIIEALEINRIEELFTLELESEIWNMSTRNEHIEAIRLQKELEEQEKKG